MLGKVPQVNKMIDIRSSSLSSLALQQPAIRFRTAKAQQIARGRKRDYIALVIT